MVSFHSNDEVTNMETVTKNVINATNGMGISGILEITFVGLIIVFAVLGIIAMMISLIRTIDEKWLEKEKIEKIEATEKEATIDALTLVLISSAVTAVLGMKRHNIKKIKLIKNSRTSWSLTGRQTIMGSHKLNKTGGHEK